MAMTPQEGVLGHVAANTPAPSFTTNQYQQLLALIGALPRPSQQHTIGQEYHMANTVGFPNNTVAGMSLNFKHSIFFAQIVNRKAYNMETWVIDTGATDHIVCSVSLLTSITGISHSMVQLPNGESVVVTHVSTIQLSSHITLTNVLCVPFFSFNLLSVSSMTKTQSLCLVFLSAHCFIQDLTNWSTIGVGQMSDGLYLLQQSSLFSASSSLVDFLSKHNISYFTAFSYNNAHNNLYSLWHSRLGHPFDVKLQSLNNIFPFLQNCCTKQCTVCPLAKQKRLPFPFNNTMCDSSFDLVHMDV